MSRGFQTFIAAGHVGADPTIKFTQGGDAIADFRIAVTEVFKDRAGNREEHTEWLRCKCFGKNAEVVQQYVKRGGLVGVRGRIVTEKWQDGQGTDRYSTWIYLDPRGGLTLMGGNDHAETRREHRGRAPAPDTTPPPPVDDSTEREFADDDFPF